MREAIRKLIPDRLIQKYRKFQEQNKKARERKDLKRYQGDKVLCPICQSKFKSFAPYGVTKRQNAQCLSCGSLERHRLLFLYLNNKTNAFNAHEQLNLLHFAPEQAFYNLFSRQENINYIPCDLFPEGYNFKGKVAVQKVDITSIPFEE